ncbi:MAG: hypothetical protein ACRDN0_24645 [Trebonia sp.]
MTAPAEVTYAEVGQTLGRRMAAPPARIAMHGFQLVAVRPVATEATDDPMSIYRLSEAGLDVAPYPFRSR